MLIIKQVISHPYFWVCIFLLLSIFGYLKGNKNKMYLSLFLSLLFASLCTPIISYWALESLSSLKPSLSAQCKNGEAKEAILLPGGAHVSNDVIKLNSLSVDRANLVFRLSKNNMLAGVILPGGYLNEGNLLASYLSSKIKSDIHIGAGSSNTAGNFEEIRDVLVEGQYYWLVTSYWHYRRASLVASKLGVKVCPVLTQGSIPDFWSYDKYAHWNGKAFIHEYLAIAYYWVLGEI
jgi:uncharacterized SAM-binding protein YcdF (DUF218 family)